jgi:hypothetical protein
MGKKIISIIKTALDGHAPHNIPIVETLPA